MGILSNIFGGKRLDYLASPLDLGIKSPWVEGSLSAVLLGDLVGEDIAEDFPMSRADALTIPAVSKARNLLVTTGSGFPIRVLDEGGPISDQPKWLTRTDRAQSPQERLANLIDDGIFYGVSIWQCERNESNEIEWAEHLQFDRWGVNPEPRADGKHEILVDEKPVDDSEIILFNFPFDGLLAVGQRTLKGARDTELAWTSRIRNPIPITELDVTDDTNLEQGEADEWLKAWEKKHRAGKPAMGMTPPGMNLVAHGADGNDAALYIENRNAIRTDVGSFVNVRASMLDGTAGIDSLTYSTTEGERNAFYEFDLPFWTSPIEARLSMDDILPAGQRARLDKYEQYAATPTPTGAVVPD